MQVRVQWRRLKLLALNLEGLLPWNVVPVTFVCDFTSFDKALYAHTLSNNILNHSAQALNIYFPCI